MAAEDTHDSPKGAVARVLGSTALLIAGGIVILGLMAWGVVLLIAGGSKATKPRAQVIAVLRQQPPPPPPKPEEKPPEIKKEEVKLPEPEPTPEPKAADEPPPAQNLGVDAAGTGAGDSFGLEGRKGGRDITTIGEVGNGAGGRAKFAFFTNMVQAHLQEELSRNKKLRSIDYKAMVRIWFGVNGKVDRAELVGSTGNPDIDSTLATALAEISPLSSAPPSDMPQPIKLRLTSRGAG